MKVDNLKCACGNDKEIHHHICGSCNNKAREYRLSESIRKQKALEATAIFYQHKSVSDKVFKEKFRFFLGLLESG